jgi:hypothetical protein
MADNDTCDKCGKTEPGIGWFAKAFRRAELRHGRPDPGNLCGSCGGSIHGKRLGAELIAKGDMS